VGRRREGEKRGGKGEGGEESEEMEGREKREGENYSSTTYI